MLFFVDLNELKDASGFKGLPVRRCIIRRRRCCCWSCYYGLLNTNYSTKIRQVRIIEVSINRRIFFATVSVMDLYERLRPSSMLFELFYLIAQVATNSKVKLRETTTQHMNNKRMFTSYPILPTSHTRKWSSTGDCKVLRVPFPYSGPSSSSKKQKISKVTVSRLHVTPGTASFGL